jgi:ADP-heptose:LPS heptosyltransferase
MTASPASPKPVPVRRYRYSKWRWRVLVRALDMAGTFSMRLWRHLRPNPQPTPPRRILVVQLDHLGDAVLSSPLFPRLRSAFPDARIDVLASPSNREVFEADPNVDRVHLAARNWFERRPGGWALGTAVWALGRILRNERYDLGIDVRGDVLTVLVMTLAGIPRRAGWAMGGGGFLLTDVTRWVPGRHEVDARLALLETLGIPPERPARVAVHATDLDRIRIGGWLRESWPPRDPRGHRPRLAARRSGRSRSSLLDRKTIENEDSNGLGESWTTTDWIAASAPLLAVHLGAGTAAKRWPTRHWESVVSRFLADGWRVVIVGGPEDIEAAGDVSPHTNLRDLTGRLSVTETAALLERADLFLGADSGPAHIAACAGVPAVILFSGTNQVRQWRPWSRRSLVLRHRVPCHPCHLKSCPLVDHPCMSGLHPDRVYRAARRWWTRMHRTEPSHAPT